MGTPLRIGVVFLLALVLEGCDSKRAEEPKPKPPVIVERFTRLPCPARPTSTLEFEGCAEHRILESNGAINKRVLTIFGLLSSTASRRSFVDSEHAWRTYRRTVCDSRAYVYEGGSAARIVFAECVADRSLAHLKDLAAFEHNLLPK